jgi:putative LysE/RhtB family amino acid efflux pump
VGSVAIGLGLGFFVALQVGPMSLFLVRSTLRSGLRVGLAIAVGIATVDALYACLGAAGAAPLLAIGPVRVALGLVGAAVLASLGLRTLLAAWHVRAGLEAPADVATPRRALVTALGATASNPSTIVSWAAIFAAASSATSAEPVLLVAGVAVGSLAWVTTLALLVSAASRAVGPTAIRVADGLAGVGLVAFGGALAHRTIADAA